MVKLCKIYEIKPRFCFKEGGTEKIGSKRTYVKQKKGDFIWKNKKREYCRGC